jgi:hypothetical protein
VTIRVHPRERIVSEARIELQEVVLDWQKKHSTETDDPLTLMEALSVINDVLSSTLGHAFKYEIRYERHGNYDKPGGEA